MLQYTGGTTGVAKGLPPARKGAWLEPAPELYVHLQALALAASVRLGSEALARYADLLGRCVAISGAAAKLGVAVAPLLA